MRVRTGRCKKTSKCIYATEIYGEKCCGYLLAKEIGQVKYLDFLKSKMFDFMEAE